MDIVREARAAALAFSEPIQTAMSVQSPSDALVEKIKEMGRKQSEIYAAAHDEILASRELDEALALLEAATQSLMETASVMKTGTAILRKANTLIGFGTQAVNAIKSVTS